MIGALEGAPPPGPLATDERAAMGARVVEGMQRAVAIAIEEQRPAAHLPRDEASGRRYLGGVAEIEPAAAEDPFALEREDLLRDEDVAINAENASGMRVDDQRRRGARPDGSSAIAASRDRAAPDRFSAHIG